MTIRELILYQVVCDECGGTAYDLGTEYCSWLNADEANEAWLDADGIAVDGRHACYKPECGIAFLSTHPDLIARRAANGVGLWWVVFDRQWKEYVAFSAYRGWPIRIESSRSLATVMDEVWAW